MKFKLTQIGCDREYGEEVTLFEDEQVGEVTVREIEMMSLGEVVRLVEDEAESINFRESYWGRYDAEVVIVCGKY